MQQKKMGDLIWYRRFDMEKDMGNVVDASETFDRIKKAIKTEVVKRRQRAPRMIDIDKFFEYMDYAFAMSYSEDREHAEVSELIVRTVRTLCTAEYIRQSDMVEDVIFEAMKAIVDQREDDPEC